MADVLLNQSVILSEALRVLHQKSHFIKTISRQYDKSFANSGATLQGKVGPNLQIRLPVKFTTRSGANVSLQDVQEYAKTLTVSTLIGVDWDFDDVDLTLTIDDFSKRYLVPAMAQLAATLESTTLNLYKYVWNQTGTAGTTPATSLAYLNAGAKLDENLAEEDGRIALINPAATAATVAGLQTLFHASAQIEKQYITGQMGDACGFKFFKSTLIPRHTVGAHGGTPLTNGGSQGITTGWQETYPLITDGWTVSTAVLNEGDVFTVANCFSVHPESKVSTGNLQQFVVRANGTSSAGGALTVTISPCPISAGAYQNVSALIADGAAIVVAGTASSTYSINLAYVESAFTVVTADLMVPKGMDMSERQEFEGISMRFVRGYQISTNQRICRFDLLSGSLAMRPELACRIMG